MHTALILLPSIRVQRTTSLIYHSQTWLAFIFILVLVVCVSIRILISINIIVTTTPAKIEEDQNWSIGRRGG